MPKTCRLLVFTDLDGTLIDHDTYSYAPAIPALTALQNAGAGLVLASSKTAVEMIPLRADIGAQAWPAIVENGAGLLPLDQSDVPCQADYTALRAILDTLPDHLRALFRGFGDMTVDQLAAITGLAPEDAACAKQRCFSEPGVWSGTHTEMGAFLGALAPHGIIAQQGGRFLTLSFGGNKVDHMQALIAQYQPAHTIALGDAPNDIAMLEQADHGIIIANPSRAPLPPLRGEETGQITRTTDAGPTGWNLAILETLDRLQLN